MNYEVRETDEFALVDLDNAVSVALKTLYPAGKFTRAQHAQTVLMSGSGLLAIDQLELDLQRLVKTRRVRVVTKTAPETQYEPQSVEETIAAAVARVASEHEKACVRLRFICHGWQDLAPLYGLESDWNLFSRPVFEGLDPSNGEHGFAVLRHVAHIRDESVRPWMNLGLRGDAARWLEKFCGVLPEAAWVYVENLLRGMVDGDAELGYRLATKMPLTNERLQWWLEMLPTEIKYRRQACAAFIAQAILQRGA